MRAGLHFAMVLAAILLASTAGFGQKRTTKPPTKTPVLKSTPAPAKPQADSNLEAVLSQMDMAAEGFRSAQADFVWDQYQKVVDETDTQRGTIFFRRRSNRETDMAADVREPEAKYVLFADGKLRLYQPRIDQVTEYIAGRNRAEFETFLVLGFGGRGHDLLRSFEVKFLRKEAVDGTSTSVLELVPKTPKVRGMFDHMLLWIDGAHGVSVKQQFFEPSGDYREARYLNVKLNQKISDDAFKLKTTGSTKVVVPQARACFCCRTGTTWVNAGHSITYCARPKLMVIQSRRGGILALSRRPCPRKMLISGAVSNGESFCHPCSS